jgi:hypothetical protein
MMEDFDRATLEEIDRLSRGAGAGRPHRDLWPGPAILSLASLGYAQEDFDPRAFARETGLASHFSPFI